MAEEQTEQEIRDEIAAQVFEGKPPETPATETPEPEPVETPEPEQEPQKDEDPLSGLDPALRQSIQSMEERPGEFDKVQHRLKQAERRIGSLTNELSTAKKSAEAPTKQEVAEASTSSQAWEDLKADYPEWGDAIGEKLEAELKSIRESIPQAQPNFDEKIQAETARMKEEFDQKLELITLRAAHPDFQTTIASDDYKEWLKSQPVQVQRLTTSTKAKDAIAILDSYQKRTKPKDIQTKRKQRLEEAQSIKGKKLNPPKSEDTMTDEEYRAKVAKRIWG